MSLIDRENILYAYHHQTPRVKEIMAGVIGPVIHNVVMSGTACLPKGFLWDIQRMAFPAFGKYEKGEFAAPCTLACRGVTCNFFKTGKVNVMGATTVADSVKRLYEALLYLYKRTGFQMRMHNLSLKNMQATVYLNYTIDIDALDQNLVDKEYEPDNISFLKHTLTITGGSVTFLVYMTGKIVMTKATSEGQFVEARDLFMPFLAQFALQYAPVSASEVDEPEPLVKPKRKRGVAKTKTTATTTAAKRQKLKLI